MSVMPRSLPEAMLGRLETLEALREEKARRDRERVANRDVFADLGFTPNPGPQTRFLSLPDENLDVLYGGAAGGSKSTSLLLYAIRSCFRYPGLQAFWFRRTFPELEHSVLRMLARYNYCRALGAVWNGSKYELRCSNGSILTFGHAKNVEEATALQSAEINLLLIDERTTIPPDVVDLLYTRVRSGVAGVPCLGIRSATNPGNIGHSRVRTDYVEATNHGQVELEDANGRRRIFIQARVSDTPQLGEEYRRGLSGLDEKLRRAYLDGDWDTFSGQVFGEWRFDRHVVEPMALPASWRRYAGIDYGYTAPFAVVWAAVDNDGRLWVYRDLSRTQVIERDQARMILDAQADDEHVTLYAADPSMWARKGEALPVADVYAEEGVHCEPANNDRILGWHRIHSYLADGPACEMHRALGWGTCPRMHVFKTCAEVIRTLPALPHATRGNPEDADTTADDHIPDATRYLCQSIGGGPEFVLLDPQTPDEVEILNPIGPFALRPAADNDLWAAGEDDGINRGVQTSPFQ